MKVWGSTKMATMRKQKTPEKFMISLNGDGSMIEKKSIFRWWPSQLTRTAPMNTIQTIE